jgi:type IV pilus assembly protein PilQ
MSVPAAGFVSQLAGVQVEKRDQFTLITIRANGTFTHTEYHPTDTLMLVDLAGVVETGQDAVLHRVSAPGVQAYRVVGYRLANGTDVTRIELTLASGVAAKVNEVAGGLEVQVNSSSAPASSSVQPVAEMNRVSRISRVAVVPDQDGLKVEISGDASLTAKATKLSGPDRIVLDIPDSVLVGHSRQIRVNSGDVKDVRAAHFQSEPPVTRVVVDMAAMHDFELVHAGKTLILKLNRTGVASDHHAGAAKSSTQQVLAAAAEPKVNAVAANVPKAGADAKGDGPVSVTVLSTSNDPAALGAGKAAAPGQKKSDQAAAHLVKPDAPALVSGNQPPLSASASLAPEPAVVNVALQQQQQPQQPQQPLSVPATTSTSCASGHYTGAPLNLDLKDLDIKDFFRLIHEISGLNVVLDPGVRGIVTIDVTDIPWDQALAIVLRNNSLECELEGNVLRIATLETLRAEAEARRAQQEAQAMAVPRQNYTRYLSYAHSKDLVTVLKKFLSPRGDIVADERSNALIIEDIPSVLPKVDALLKALDRKTPEVEIEARVVSAQRTFAQDIGTQLGFGWGNGPSAAGGGSGTPSPLGNKVPNPRWLTIPGGATPTIPLFSNLPAIGPTSGLAFTNASNNVRLDFVLSMAESRGLVKILSRPRVVTQNNISAIIRQGQQIPVVTQAQLGGPPTVTYVNAFLRLTVTPQITNENTIFLLLDVENTTADFAHVTGQQLNPTLDTQQTTTQVLVSDGQTVVIGGVIATNNSLALNQVPLLGNIPILGNLFKHTAINTTTAELLFFITPKIIQT